ncbi:hypothetical protein [Methanogenium organophilum]|uniref:Uncharacterized protein n=1 Tax=Methanogenium organophilum TaxID=2199 RepID=A0A9X9S2U4_METOG|nr:hypothetical protein [Methanogenium organophilum]WAI00472.1 hypothetical protein OU421_08525 [Methanogenium organophilum]
MGQNNDTGNTTGIDRDYFGDLSFEVIILSIFGIFMLIFGTLLFKIHTGELPYTPDSTYGLFLVIVSLQIIVLGRTPFGDLRRSWIVIIIGVCTTAVGMTACFIPGCLSDFVRILVGSILFAGGIALFIQLCLAEEKAKQWLSVSGILRHLTLACALVYIISAVLGLVTLLPGITGDTLTAVILLVYGVCIFYLAYCIHVTNTTYPQEEEKYLPESSKKRSPVFSEAAIPLQVAIIIPVGFLLILLGILLIPVNLGMIPFSPDGQLGLLMVVMAVQMLALGETPAGGYRRSWLLMGIGVVFAGLGIISCVVPGIFTGVLTGLIGFLNIAGGVILLLKRFGPTLLSHEKTAAKQAPLPPVLKNLYITQTILNFVSIGFGASMFLPGIIPGMVIAGILVVNGVLIIVLASAVLTIDKMQREGMTGQA